MIAPNFITRLIARFVSVSCLFIFAATIYAQNPAPAAKPAANPAPKPAPAASTARPAAAPVPDKPLSFRFREIEKDSDQDRVRNQLSTMISKGQFDDPKDKEVLVQYFKDYFFGRWVNYGKFYQMETYPETLRKQARSAKKPTDKKRLETAAARWNYPCFIEDLRKDLDRSRSDGEPQKIAVKAAYDFAMEVIPSNNIHCTPAVKYNCVLLLGNLYYKTTSSSSDLPVAFAPAVDALLKIASGAKTPRYLRIGAIMSLNQLISETNLSEKNKSEIYNVLLGIAKVKVDPSTFASSKDDPSGEGALWTRNLAIEGLRLLADFNPKVDKTQGFYPGKEAIGVLFQIINDKSAPMTTRIAALESLGSYNFNKYPELKANVQKLLKSATSLVIEAIQVELDRKVDTLVWGDDAEQYSRHNAPDDPNSEPVDNTNNSIFLLQRALPAVYALNVALNGVKSDKGWKGLSSLDAPVISEMNDSLKEINLLLNDISKEIMPSDSRSDGGMDGEDGYVTDKLQEVAKVLADIQDILRPYTE